MATFQLNIISVQGKVFGGEAVSVVAPGVEGDFGVLAGHAPMIALIRRGVGKVETESGVKHYVFGEGVLEVSKEEVVLLVNAADKAETHEAAVALAAEQAKAAAVVPKKAAAK